MLAATHHSPPGGDGLHAPRAFRHTSIRQIVPSKLQFPTTEMQLPGDSKPISAIEGNAGVWASRGQDRREPDRALTQGHSFGADPHLLGLGAR